ncbi:MAG: NAD(P)/FAD-dependent oxidoreductase [Candidatus Omnitrophota bacterium]|nr:NAD(P)/FAD-dependent oxidoreductase [Candidatus Omnitrophota bacterium]
MSVLNSKYDVIIIGAGPVGIYASIRLAEAGFGVLVIEEDAQIGKPRFCTGLISKEAFDQFSLPEGAIEEEFSFATIFSPSGLKLRLKSKSPVYATDRTTFDQGLYRRAKEAGVKFLLSCRCLALKVNNDFAEVKVALGASERIIRAEVIILATGIKYSLHKFVGLTLPPDFLDCSQVQTAGRAGEGIEIYLGNSIAPRSFAWVVPLRKNELRIGMSTYQNSVSFLKTLLKKLSLKGDFNIMRRPIPLGTIKNTYTDRVLAVGDAAGQVKPTTGGGIYFGLLCADLAAKTIIDAFKAGDFSKKFLRRYEINWKKRIEFDLTMGLYLRKLIADFSDEQIEKLIQFSAQEQTQRIIEKYGDFNHHGRLIKELVKRPLFWKSLYQMLISK